jgi:hypothetical protein
MKIKAQSSMEFFLLVGLAFIATIVFVALAINEVKEYNDQKQYLLIKDMALRLQKEISIASTVEDGYYRSFSLVEKLDGSVNYDTAIINRSLSINASKSTISVPITTVYGNNFTKGTNIITKEDGKVYVNKE